MVFYNNISFLKLKQGDPNNEFPIIENIWLPNFFQPLIQICALSIDKPKLEMMLSVLDLREV